MNQNKRQLSSSSSTESLTGYRIPKKVDLKATPTKLDMASSSAATMTSPVKTEEETMEANEADSEVQDLQDEQIEDIESQAKGDNTDGAGFSGGGVVSYADAAGKKVKKDYPYTLYVQQGTTKREPISKAHFSSFEKHLWKERFKLEPEDNARIIIDFVAHHNGYGIVACTSPLSSTWVKKVALAFTFGTVGTRAWSRWERGQALIFSGFLHGNCYKEPDMKAKYVLSTILKWNGLQGNFEILTWDCKKANGVFLSFEPKGPLAAKLSNMKRLNAGNCTLVLQKRLRKARTELEFQEFQKKKDEDELQRKAKAAGRRGSAAAADR